MELDKEEVTVWYEQLTQVPGDQWDGGDTGLSITEFNLNLQLNHKVKHSQCLSLLL